jgi:hypothetical protein
MFGRGKGAEEAKPDLEQMVSTSDALPEGLRTKLDRSPTNNEAFLHLPDDVRYCLFGPQYFRGVAWGAAVSSVAVLFLGRSSYKRAARLVPAGSKKSIYEVDPSAYAMVCASVGTGVLKFCKFWGAAQRYNEFLRDEEMAAYAMEHSDDSALRAGGADEDSATSDDDMARLEVMTMMRKAMAEGVAPPLPGMAADDAERLMAAGVRDRAERERHAASELWRKTGGVVAARHDQNEGRMPGFMDGVSVGVWGSLQDAYNPVKPPSAYLDMRAGRTVTGS